MYRSRICLKRPGIDSKESNCGLCSLAGVRQ